MLSLIALWYRPILLQKTYELDEKNYQRLYGHQNKEIDISLSKKFNNQN